MTLEDACQVGDIDLTSLVGTQVSCTFGDNNDYQVKYTACSDQIDCVNPGGSVMAVQESETNWYVIFK